LYLYASTKCTHVIDIPDSKLLFTSIPRTANNTLFRVLSDSMLLDLAVNHTVQYRPDKTDIIPNGFVNSTMDKYMNTTFLTLLRTSSCGMKSFMHEHLGFGQSENRNGVGGQWNHATSKVDRMEFRVLNVVAHVRRGDVSPNFKIRYTSDDFYIRVLQYIKKQYPNANLNAFTSIEDHSDSKNSINLKYLYAEAGIRLHVARERSPNATIDAMSAFYHMMSADVFIMSRSSFSTVAAYYNPNCVLYIPYWHAPLKAWISLPWQHFSDSNSTEMIEVYRLIGEGLPRCLSK
jgi:hypothetical protein